MPNTDADTLDFGVVCMLCYIDLNYNSPHGETIFIGTFSKIKEIDLMVKQFARSYGKENGLDYGCFFITPMEFNHPMNKAMIKRERIEEIIESMEEDE